MGTNRKNAETFGKFNFWLIGGQNLKRLILQSLLCLTVLLFIACAGDGGGSSSSPSKTNSGNTCSPSGNSDKKTYVVKSLDRKTWRIPVNPLPPTNQEAGLDTSTDAAKCYRAYFSGWYTQPNGAGDKFKFADSTYTPTVNVDTTLHAHWTVTTLQPTNKKEITTHMESGLSPDTIDTSKLEDMSYALKDDTTGDSRISGWDTSNVTNMKGMLQYATATGYNIGGWNTSKVTDMSYMFNNASKINESIGGWDTSKVTNMSHMFEFSGKFNENIGDWDTSQVTSMEATFKDAFVFNQDLSWDTSQVTTMKNMFSGAKIFNGNISG